MKNKIFKKVLGALCLTIALSGAFALTACGGGGTSGDSSSPDAGTSGKSSASEVGDSTEDDSTEDDSAAGDSSGQGESDDDGNWTSFH